jgi:DNA-binding response OmpR family regulator
MPNCKKTLLLVDDDLDQLTMRKIVFELLGYAVVTAADPRRGMQLFKSEAPDAVVLDYEMPTMDGGVLASKIRRTDGAIPIVMLSGCDSVPSSALTAVDTFVPKAMAPSLLIAAIRSLVGGQEVFA